MGQQMEPSCIKLFLEYKLQIVVNELIEISEWEKEIYILNNT